MTDLSKKAAVSICIPTYEHPEELKRLLDSIWAQTYTDYEVIITDDSRSEAVAQLCASYHEDRLRYYHNEKALGHIYNWNCALEKATGDYIKIMFSDDWFTTETSLETFVQMLQDVPEASFAFSGSMQVSESKAYARAADPGYVKALHEDYRTLFLGNQVGAPSATMYRACDALFDERSNWASDMFLYLEVLQKNPVFVSTDAPLISIGISDAQYTETFSERDPRKYEDFHLLYEKYALQGCEVCRQRMLLMNVQFGKGRARAIADGATGAEYLKASGKWFWRNTILGYWNGLLYHLKKH